MSDIQLVALFVSGMLTTGYAVAALYFMKFWRQTNDRLFAFFATAFGLLVVQRIALTFAVGAGNNGAWYYVIRLLAFVVIIVAIVDKNRSSRA